MVEMTFDKAYAPRIGGDDLIPKSTLTRIANRLLKEYKAVDLDGDLYNTLFNTSVAVLDNIVDSAQLKFARMRVSVSLNNKGNLTIKFTYSDGATVEV